MTVRCCTPVVSGDSETRLHILYEPARRPAHVARRHGRAGAVRGRSGQSDETKRREFGQFGTESAARSLRDLPGFNH